MNDIKITTLENGLRIVTVGIPGIRTATTTVSVKVGSRYETKENSGISHALEHHLFKSTKNRSTLEISKQIEKVGAYVNAYTDIDRTVYYIGSLSEHTELAVDILSDMMINPLFPQNEVETEREVILQEISRAYDDPYGLAYDLYNLASFKDQSIGRPILGDEKFIANLSREDLYDYKNKHYVTGNTIVSCVGQVNHDDFVALVKKYFNDYAVGSATVPEPAVYNGGYECYSKEFEQYNIMFGFPTCGIIDDNAIAYDVLSIVLGGGMSSPLFNEVREKRGLVYSVASYSFQHSDSGSLMIYAGTTPDNVDELFTVSIDELKKLVDNITDDDFIRAKNKLKSQLLMSLEKPASVTSDVVNDLFNFGEIKGIDYYVEKIDAVTKDQLKQLTKEMLTKTPTVSMVGPVTDTDYYTYIKNLVN